MKYITAYIFAATVLLCVISGCKDASTGPQTSLTELPVVTKTSSDYTLESFERSFPHSEILTAMSKAYAHKCSDEVREALIDYMKKEAADLGEDASMFDALLTLSGCRDGEGLVLPTYAERARFNGQEAWIIQVAWGYDAADFGHFKCYAFGIANKELLATYGCK